MSLHRRVHCYEISLVIPSAPKAGGGTCCSMHSRMTLWSFHSGPLPLTLILRFCLDTSSLPQFLHRQLFHPRQHLILIQFRRINHRRIRRRD